MTVHIDGHHGHMYPDRYSSDSSVVYSRITLDRSQWLLTVIAKPF